MPADEKAIEDALHGFVRDALGLPGQKVIWSRQTGPRPQVPFAALGLDGDSDLSFFAEQRTRKLTPSENPQPGADLLLETVRHTEFTLSINFFAEGDDTGSNSARAQLKRLCNKLDLESTTDRLDAVGLALVNRGTVQNTTGLLETSYESRATFDMRLRVAVGAEELNTWIETAEVETTITK